MGTVVTTPRGLLTLTGSLLTQVEPGDAVDLAGTAAAAGGGLVVCGKAAMQVACYLREKGFAGPLLVDRQRYKGRRRSAAGDRFDEDWICRQRKLGLPAVLPDAGYVAEGDLEGLRSILIRSAAIPDAVALLALANWWLHGPGLRLLLGELVETPVPIALVVEHRDDPLGVRRVLAGVLEVLRAGTMVLPLRCDVSAVGLLAHGALAAAYGSRTSLRHLYPSIAGGGGPRRESAFWPAGMALHYTDLLYDAVTASPRDPGWRCYCPACDGSRLDRFAADRASQEIRRHNTASLLRLRHSLMARPSGTARTRLWSTWCAEATAAHALVSAGPVVVTTPKALENWQLV